MMIIQEILNKVEQYDSIVIFGHKNPDGDCYGAQVGLKELLKSLYPHKNIYIIGSGYSRMIPFIMPMDVVSDEVVDASLGIAVDFNELSRSEDQRIHNVKELIVIDHHIPNEVFGDIRLVDTSKVACAEIIAKIAIDLDIKLSASGYNALYLGLATDSGRFMYPPFSGDTLRIGAYLLDKGADAAHIYDVIYESDESHLELRKYIYTHYKKTENGLIYILFTKDDINKLGISIYKATGFVNTLGNIKGLPVWAAFAEDETGIVRVEVRSTWPVVQPIMKAHGGGGHPHAAGCTAHSLEEVYDIIKELDDLIAKGENND